MKTQKNLICDANIWYDLASGSIHFREFVKRGATVCVAPFTIAEIVGGITEENYEARKNACKSIRKARPKILPDEGGFYDESDSTLSDLLGYVTESQKFDGLSSQLFYDSEVVGYNYIVQTRAWREATEASWMRRVGGAVASCIERLRGGGRRYLTALATKSEFPKWSPKLKPSEIDFVLTEIDAQFSEAMQSIGTGATPESEIACYRGMYKAYLIDLLTKPKKPKNNDRLDLELFHYSITPDYVVVTRDRIWGDYAVTAGFDDRVVII